MGNNGGTADELGGIRELSREDFMNMSLKEIEEVTGVIRPDDHTGDAIEEYREQAWRSYQTDVTNRDDWGNARQTDEPAE